MWASYALAVLAASLSIACAPKTASSPQRRGVTGEARILEVRAEPDPIAEDVTIVRFVFSGSARYKVLELPSRHEIWIDVDGGVPDARTSQAGGAVDRISYTTATHSDGHALGRVVLHLEDETYGLVSSRGNGAGRVGELRIGPNREIDQSAPPRLRKTLGDGPADTE